ncbi:MAG: outer membrane beta-barrel protein [Deltaproteobacteria bacterium]|nr:outer membrane beta-barrel protein [Deltaproteobacteria bacterium]
MFRTRIFAFTVCLFLIVAVNAGAEEERAHLLKDNAFSIKAGYHLYPSSDFMDSWNINQDDFNGFIGEVAYERRLYKYLWLEVAVGYFQSSEESQGTLLAGDSLDLTIISAYLSPTLKLVFPIADALTVYAGAGPDYYYTESRLKYQTGGFTYDRDETFNSFGAHGLAGIEIYIMKKPTDFGFWDAPVGIFFEYKYTWLPVKDFDGELIRNYNAAHGTSYESHDADVGGHAFFGGFRWHF